MNNGNIQNTTGGGGRIKRNLSHSLYSKIISLDNLILSWNEFKIGKENKLDIQQFSLKLEDNIFKLYKQLENNIYRHSDYTSFYIQDPKLRHIHKAQVQDRILHHAIIRIIEPQFDKSFTFDSYSSRKDKGTHKAVKRLNHFAWKLSQNNTKTVWILKCDIRRFFASVDHELLINLIKKNILDDQVTDLIKRIIYSFKVEENKGIPLGNLTSQLFSNIYLNELDQYVKRKLQVKYYIRYADDFVLLSGDRQYLEGLLIKVNSFLNEQLNLQLHPHKLSIQKWNQGIDFLGYISFSYHNILRTKTKRRMINNIGKKLNHLTKNKISIEKFNQSLQSYLGILKHCRGNRIIQEINRIIGE